MKTKLEFDIDIPSVPNFLHSKDGRNVIAIRNVSEKNLKEIARLWTNALIKKAKKK